MLLLLASANRADSPQTNLLMILFGLGGIVCVCGLAFVPLAIAAHRRIRLKQTMLPLVLLWGLIASGSMLRTVVQHFQWSKDHEILLESGDFDPATNTDPPPWPWIQWTAIAAGYAALLGATAISQSTTEHGV